MFTITITGDTPEQISHSVLSFAKLLNGSAYSTINNPLPPPAHEPDDDNEPMQTIPVGALDKFGMPWDARIHSEKKGTNQDGSWRKRRGVDQTTIQEVETELRSRATTQSAPPQPPTMPPPPAPVAPTTPPPAVATPPVPPQSPPPAAPVAPTTPPPPVAPTMPTTPAVDFGYVMRGMQAGMTTNPVLIDQAFVTWLAQQIGVANIPEMGNDPAKVAHAYQLLKEHNRWVEPAASA